MNDSFKRVQSRGYSGFARVLTIAAMLLLTAATGAWAQTETYTVRMKKGTKDADKWTVSPTQATTTGVMKDTPVSLTYGGRLKVKDVTAKFAIIDLSEVTEHTSIEDGYTITGTLDGQTQPYKISIADGATVTLDNVTINGVNNNSYEWAGLTCEGSATIILKDGSTNTVKGFHKYYPGILVPKGKTLIIKGEAAGTGALTASPFNGGGNRSYGAGIGCEYVSDCGNIEIQGGNITATGGYYAAGIGSGAHGSSCGDITISGGTITATGGNQAAGIGSGYSTGNTGEPISSCGTISITTGVTKVTATKGSFANNSIGAGKNSTCGKVTIGCTVYWQDNAAVDDDADAYLKQATIVYPQTVVDLSTLEDDYEAQDCDVLKGSTSTYSVTIADGATVTLDGVTFSSTISCSGDATIILMGTNTLNGGLQASPSGKTMTITGTGSLNARSYEHDPGIGAIDGNNCGNIIICGGTITAQPGDSECDAAGIGSGEGGTCGNITICGGTVTAIGGVGGAGIGSGYKACGTVTITDGATKVTATKGSEAQNSIGKGKGSCGTVTIDGVVNATTSSTFEHFNSSVSGNTWTLTHK